ncbi:MAG: hypothetical protein ACTSUO_05860 [Candidatus Thorarchaeota archaeon]
MTSDKENIQKAMKAIEDGDRETAMTLLVKVADNLSSKGGYKKAANLYEKAANLAKDLYRADESFSLLESAVVMFLRDGSPEFHSEIARIYSSAGKIADDATEYKMAAEFYSRAGDFVSDKAEQTELMIKAGDALENQADLKEEEGEFGRAVSLLKKVGRIYYSVGDDELGKRIYIRATKLALRWAESAKDDKEYLSAGNALAEAAQIMQATGDSAEAIRIMMEAGDHYERVNLHEKAGNIFDAAADACKMERLTSAHKQAMTKAAEAYLKMEGNPEVLSPLLVKAGDMFTEIGRPMKAKWAFKRANDLFAELAKISSGERDTETEKSYLRHQAMCLDKWGRKEEAEALYKEVTDYFLGKAKEEEDTGNKESQGLFLESASDVLFEAGFTDEGKTHMERALELYIELADTYSTSGNNDEGSRFYSKAAACAGKMDDADRESSFYWVASEKADLAAKAYQEMELAELATIWIRTAGLEALKTRDPAMIEKAIILLQMSADGFKTAHEQAEAFNDLFTVVETLILYNLNTADKTDIINEMEEISKFKQESSMLATVPVIKAIGKGNHLRALLHLQEREEDLLKIRERLRTLIALISKQ